MSFISFFKPQILARINSPINGEIQVIEHFGERFISVGGLTQSGGLLKNVWKKGLREIVKIKYARSNILILGLGGGTIVGMINQYYPNSEITGVDMDPMMVEFGKRYLDLRRAVNLKTEIADAFTYINQTYRKDKYDLIVTDLYLGKKSPEKLTSKSFLSKLRRMLTPEGVVIFNRLVLKTSESDINLFLTLAKQIFPKVQVIKPLVNWLIICSL